MRVFDPGKDRVNAASLVISGAAVLRHSRIDNSKSIQGIEVDQHRIHPWQLIGRLCPESSDGMALYRNFGLDSGVGSYEIGDSFIEVTFRDCHTYRYSYASAGKGHVERMKSLAMAGRGLNSYINTHVKKRYESKG